MGTRLARHLASSPTLFPLPPPSLSAERQQATREKLRAMLEHATADVKKKPWQQVLQLHEKSLQEANEVCPWRRAHAWSNAPLARCFLVCYTRRAPPASRQPPHSFPLIHSLSLEAGEEKRRRPQLYALAFLHFHGPLRPRLARPVVNAHSPSRVNFARAFNLIKKGASIHIHPHGQREGYERRGSSSRSVLPLYAGALAFLRINRLKTTMAPAKTPT